MLSSLLTRPKEQLLQVAGHWIQDRMEHINLGEQQFGLFGGKSLQEIKTEFANGLFFYLVLYNFYKNMPIIKDVLMLEEDFGQGFL